MAAKPDFKEAAKVVRAAHRFAVEHSSNDLDEVDDFAKRSLAAIADKAARLLPDEEILLPIYDRMSKVIQAVGKSGGPEVAPLKHKEARVAAAIIAETVGAEFGLKIDGTPLSVTRKPRRSEVVTVRVDANRRRPDGHRLD